jgi:uncharacterized membrane protein YhaH (DUF805 family)
MSDMTPIQWALRPLERYADFRGRASRAEYWWFYLATIIVGLVAEVADGTVGSDEFGWIGGIVNLALIVPTIAVTVRRLHDTDRSGWWLVLGLVAIIGLVTIAVAGSFREEAGISPLMIVAGLATIVVAITLFVFMVLPGNEGPNRYGDDPYGPGHLEEIFG